MRLTTFVSITAGVFCAIVSHPADTIVSKLNQDKGSTFVQIAKRLGFVGKWRALISFANNLQSVTQT